MVSFFWGWLLLIIWSRFWLNGRLLNGTFATLRRGLYRDGVFRFIVTLPKTYNAPNAHPDIVFTPPIFNPLIHPSVSLKQQEQHKKCLQQFLFHCEISSLLSRPGAWIWRWTRHWGIGNQRSTSLLRRWPSWRRSSTWNLSPRSPWWLMRKPGACEWGYIKGVKCYKRAGWKLCYFHSHTVGLIAIFHQARCFSLCPSPFTPLNFPSPLGFTRRRNCSWRGSNQK